MHVSLDRANLNAFNIPTPGFCIWQDLNSNWTTAHVQTLVDVPKVPISQLYKYMIGQKEPILPFEINSNIEERPSLTWKVQTHPWTNIGTIGMILCLGVYCFRNFWFRPATPRHWPYSPLLLQHAVVDDDVEAAPIYRSAGTVQKPVRPHKNHALCIEWEATKPESHCKHPVLSKAVTKAKSLATETKIQGMQ